MAASSSFPLPISLTANVLSVGTNTTSISMPQGNNVFASREQPLQESDLSSAAFNTPVQQLINLWCARFGHEWVALDAVVDDAFFGRAYMRLKQLGELEVHFLTDRSRYVCRVPQ